MDAFSVQWSGMIQPRYSGGYTFTPLSDDGARLYINGQLIVDAWTDRSTSDPQPTGSINLAQGVNYSIVYEVRKSISFIFLTSRSISRIMEVLWRNYFGPAHVKRTPLFRRANCSRCRVLRV